LLKKLSVNITVKVRAEVENVINLPRHAASVFIMWWTIKQYRPVKIC